MKIVLFESVPYLKKTVKYMLLLGLRQGSDFF